ncbi:MAG TPA: flagellar M-ring protein FliF [Clostridiaceae bacterium]|nr:flagellar M-ring protein FliF [Clostridiaceae bacterium]
MPEFFTKVKEQVIEFWNNLDKNQKKRLYITSAIVVVAISVGIILLTRPNYVTLVRSTDTKQIAEIKKILDDNQIWNKLDDNGESIIIKQSDKGKARIAVSDKGYPKYGLTFEDAISMIGISTTESDRKHIWRQQEKSEIESMIMSYDNIENAEVNLAIPEKTLFSIDPQEQSRPKAIVRITPKEKLTPEQVQGIVMLVSRSVVDLKPEDVTVVDNFSNILNVEPVDDSIYAANTQEKLRRDMELHLQKKVYDYFSVGQFENFDTIRVVINPVLDFEKVKSQSKTLSNPEGMDGGALLNSDILKESVENASTAGEPGVGTNPGNANSPSYMIADGGNASYDKTHEVKNFAYNETITELEKPTGKLVPEQSTAAISLWYGQRVTDDSKLSDEFLNEVRLVVSMATGIPVSNITVNKMKLAQPETTARTASEIIKDFISTYGFFILLLLLIVGLIIMALPRRKKEEVPIPVEPQPALAVEPKFVVPEKPDVHLPEIDLEEKSELKKQIEKFVKQKPEAVAQLLRNWLSDDWDV